MKSLSWSVGALAILAVAVGAGLAVRGFAGSGAAEEPSGPSQTLLLGVERMTCGSCEARIRQALEERPGVTAVAVDLASRTVAVEYAAGTADPRVFAEAVTRAGFPARFLGLGDGPLPVRPKAAAGKGCAGGCCPG
ncbi:MAG: heavy-metal-associated domain-containing protein [Deferrisomatales bacterium]